MSTAASPSLGAHGATRLPSVDVEGYNVEIKDEDGFLGDRASKEAFLEIVEKWRKPFRKAGLDPFGETSSEELGRKALDTALAGENLIGAGVTLGVIEDFSQAIVSIIKRLVRTKAWRGVERIVMGGGMREHRLGELAIGRTAVLLRADGVDLDIRPIRHHPDEAGLLGAVQLAPTWIFEAHDSILAVDIGGTNMRAGLLRLNLKKAPDLTKVEVFKRTLWKHAEDSPKREEVVEELVSMLEKLIRQAEKSGLRLAPFIGIGCPGRIEADGSIDRGAQNLPGNWESERFNLPSRLHEAIPSIGDHESVVVMHNDAVVQGLSQAPFMRDIERWGVLTMGTGLGNACFLNREPPGKDSAS